MSFDGNSLEDSMIFSEGPTTLIQRLGYVRQLIFSKTKLEFRLLWNRIFQKEDEELGWLLNPYRQGNSRADATMMSSFNKNVEESSYQYNYDDVSGIFGKERVTIYNRGVARKGDSRRKRKPEKTTKEKLIQLARDIGMGVTMTSTAFPSPFYPVNDNALYTETIVGDTVHTYTMSRIW